MDLRVLDLMVAFVAGLGAGLLITTLLDQLERDGPPAQVTP
jgi:hypothetical protein